MGLFACPVEEDKNTSSQNDTEDSPLLTPVIVDTFSLEDNCVKFGAKTFIR